MADFRYRLRDLDDPDAIADQIMAGRKDHYKTTTSKSGTRSPLDVTLFSASQILMGVPAQQDPLDTLAEAQAKVFSGLSVIASDIAKIPGLDALIPDFLKQKIAQASPDGFSILNSEGTIPAFGGSFPSAAKPFISEAISLAKSEVGYEEEPKGSNVNKYADNVGVKNGEKWTMAFLMSVFKDARIPQKGLLSNDVQDTFDLGWSVNRYGETPKRGAIAFFNFSGTSSSSERSSLGFDRKGRGVDHAGLVVEVDGDIIVTVEGDVPTTKSGDFADGYKVMQKKRRKSVVVGYIYPVYPDGEVVNFPTNPTAEAEGASFTGPTEIIKGKAYSWPKYEGASTDSKGPRPGATALMDYLLDKYSLTSNLGIYNYRQTAGGGTSLSVHSEGRALDVGVPVNDAGKKQGDQIFLLLAPKAAQLGIQAIHWQSTWWSSNSPDSRDGFDHFDHLHIELTKQAGAQLTSSKILSVLETTVQPAQWSYSKRGGVIA